MSLQKRGKRVSKKKSSLHHFKKRAALRLDIQITDEKIKEIIKIIQSGKAELIEKQSLRVRKYNVTLEGSTFTVIYDKVRKTPVSVWDPEKKSLIDTINDLTISSSILNSEKIDATDLHHKLP